MPAREPTVVEFHEDRRSAVIDRMVTMAEAGAGWINLSPGLDVDVPPPTRSGLASLVGSRGPTVPLGTWSAAQRRQPATVGVHHGEGPKAVALLADRGVALPEGWRRMQDHPKRGLVLVPIEASTAGQLDDVLPSGGPRIAVSPFVFAVPAGVVVTAEPREVASTVWIPLEHLTDPASAAEHLHPLPDGGRLRFPALAYRHFVIWGLTYRMLIQFLGIVRAAAPDEVS